MREQEKKATIFIELAGGLGNQLFTYFAGLFLASRLGVGLTPFVHDSFWGVAQKGRGISGLRLTGNGLKLNSASLSRSPWTIKWRGKITGLLIGLGLSRNLTSSVMAVYQSPVVGEDEGISSIQPGYLVRGHFQTQAYFNAVLGNLPKNSFELVEASSWFVKMESEAIVSRPITLHVRRGDYLDEKNSFIGALSGDYFLEALSLLKKDVDFQDREVWVFSNDINSVKSELGGRLEGKVRWIVPPPDSPEAESLLLLGKGEALVMSNSTFSWWAAAIGNPRRVVAPSKWFRGADDPHNLLMTNWEKVESRWL
jgi:hypothetical protein